MPLRIALVGRPNVGKSTIFNRLTKSKKSIVHDMPGVTRDRNYGTAYIGPLEFEVIDTPGLEEAEATAIEYRMMKQTEKAIDEADLVFLVVDGKSGLNVNDNFFAKWIKQKGVKARLLINKCEGRFYPDGAYYGLGLGEPIPVSGEHGDGITSLYDIIAPLAAEIEDDEKNIDHDTIRITIAGRPNTGKSTFINALIGEDRLLTGPEAGITRDAIEIEWNYLGTNIKLVDTAGMRKKAGISKQVEKLSVSSSLRSIRFANTVVLMLDASLSLERQDLTIANLVIEEGRGLVVAVNKSDLIEDQKAFQEELEYRLEKQLAQLKGVQVVYLSALNKKNIYAVIDTCIKVYNAWNTRLTTGMLNRWLEEALSTHTLPLQSNGRRLKIKYITQVKSRPPTFKLFCNKPNDIPDSYSRYLLNSLRISFDFFGVPIRMNFVGGDNPYKE
jgi:GTP-binding protein